VIHYRSGEIDVPRKSVVITVDDGRMCFYNYALQISARKKIPVTGFLIVRDLYRNEKEKMKAFEKYSKKEYRRLVNLESHTYNMHLRPVDGRTGKIMYATKNEIVKDIKKSIKTLGRSEALAYPFGQYNNVAKEAVKEAGIKLAFTTKSGKLLPGMDPYALPRMKVNASTTLRDFKKLLEN
jgi:peptidoglycan/xylan/chitin deacetylase (PgdA/CDA1 family)